MSSLPSTRSPALAALLSLALFVASPPSEVEARPRRGRNAAATDDQDYLQAKHYFKRGHLDLARRSLDRALARKGPARSAKVLLLAARIYRDQREYGRALDVLSRALGSARGETREKVEALLASLRKGFGQVRLIPARSEELTGPIFVEPARRLINAEQKDVVQAAQRALLEEPRSWPGTFWLPYGEYEVNGVRYKHEAESIEELEVPFPKIALLRSDEHAADEAVIEAFRRSAGARVQVLNMRGELEVGQLIARKLRKQKPKLIVALGAKAAVVCRRELKRFRLLFGMIEGGWVRYGLRGDKARVTGVSLQAPLKEQVERLRRLSPGVRRIGLIYNPALGAERLDSMRGEAEELDLQIEGLKVSVDTSLRRTLRDLQRFDALWMLPDPPLTRFGGFRALLEASLRAKRPLLVPSGTLVASGAFTALAADREVHGEQLGELARRVLFRGEKPEDIEVQPPRTLRWHVNLAYAARAGIALPQQTHELVDELHRSMPALEAR